MSRFQLADSTIIPVEITVSTVKRVRKLLGVDLASIFETDLLQQLACDSILLVDVLFVVCQEWCQANNYDDEKFGRAMQGDTIAVATQAFMEALTLFFPPVKRPALMKALAKIGELEAKDVELAIQRLDSPAIEATLDRFHLDKLNELDKLARPASGKPSTTVRAGSAFVQTDSPSANS